MKPCWPLYLMLLASLCFGKRMPREGAWFGEIVQNSDLIVISSVSAKEWKKGDSVETAVLKVKEVWKGTDSITEIHFMLSHSKEFMVDDGDGPAVAMPRDEIWDMAPLKDIHKSKTYLFFLKRISGAHITSAGQWYSPWDDDEYNYVWPISQSKSGKPYLLYGYPFSADCQLEYPERLLKDHGREYRPDFNTYNICRDTRSTAEMNSNCRIDLDKLKNYAKEIKPDQDRRRTIFKASN